MFTCDLDYAACQHNYVVCEYNFILQLHEGGRNMPPYDIQYFVVGYRILFTTKISFLYMCKTIKESCLLSEINSLINAKVIYIFLGFSSCFIQNFKAAFTT